MKMSFVLSVIYYREWSVFLSVLYVSLLQIANAQGGVAKPRNDGSGPAPAAKAPSAPSTCSFVDSYAICGGMNQWLIMYQSHLPVLL